jgi:Fe-S cluster biogenesis protein NfuA
VYPWLIELVFIPMPKIAEIEPTPNPNAMKFVLKDPLTWGVSRSYASADEAKDDPLASALFDIEHVSNVFYVDHWITVTQDGGANWQELMRTLAVPIREAPAADADSARYAEQAATGMNTEKLSEEDKRKLDRINELLDDQVRPYLQGDGGDLYIVGLEGNRLMVHYQGACGSCPSSISGTLAGIEGLVRQVEPELEVVAV